MMLTNERTTIQGSQPQSTKTIRAGVLGTINELDPRKAVDYVSGLILDQIFDTPYVTTDQAVTRPSLFETLRAESATGMLYSAAVRPGIAFSDGTPLTADLAARSLHGSTALSRKAVIDVRGDRVWFMLSSPNPRLDLTLTHSSCAIVIEKSLQLLGTGPFMFPERPNLRLLQKATSLRLIRNPQYHGTSGIDEIEFQVLPPDGDGTPRSLVEALRSGAIDLTTALSASDLSVWKIAGVAPVTRPSNSTALLFMNSGHTLLASSPARKGIASAIDVLEIASQCYGRNPAAFIATTVLPPAMGRNGGVPRNATGEAARLLEQAGLFRAHLTLLVPWAPRPYLPKPIAVAQIIQKQLLAVGVVISLIETKTSDDYFARLSGGRFHMALGGWIADTPDPADYFEALLSSHVIGNTVFSNHCRWNDARTDDLLGRFRVDPSDANRREIEQLIADETPFLPLIYGQSSIVHTRRVRDVTLTPTGSIPLAGLTVL